MQFSIQNSSRNKILPVILCGGSGSRLQPLSSEENPKQFLNIFEGQNLFQRTLALISDNTFEKPLIVSNHTYKTIINKYISLETVSEVIYEPKKRNTLPAICLAAIKAKYLFGENITLLVLPSDHYIKDKGIFLEKIFEAEKIAAINKIVVFGIEAEYAETQYGYIKASGNKVLKFIEKPDAVKAERLIQEGDNFWNSGIFMFKCRTILEEIEKFEPEIYRNCADMGLKNFNECKSVSIDHGIIEKTSKLGFVRLPAELGWNDMGSLHSLFQHFRQGEEEKVSINGFEIAKSNEGYSIISKK